jgi:hypothetical protein
VYFIDSITNITSTNWIAETNFTASGDFTQVPIAKGARSNLFLRASTQDFRDYGPDTNLTFNGLTYSNTYTFPPDAMGAAGPNHFVEVVNQKAGTDGIAVYAKSDGHFVAWTYNRALFCSHQRRDQLPNWRAK